MKKLYVSLIMLVLLQFNVPHPNCTAASVSNNNVDVGAEKEKVRAVLQKLGIAVQTKNMELFSEVYAHGKDIIIIGPDSREMAFDWRTLAYIKNQQFNDLSNIQVFSSEEKITIDSSGTVARYFVESNLSFVSSGVPFHVKGVRETGVLEKENDKWVIVQQHVSAPVDDKIWPFYFEKYQQDPIKYDVNRIFGIKTLKEDYDLLRLALEEAHAGMYRYTSKTEFDAFFNSLYMKINKGMTEIEFFRFISPIIENIHCVHTAAHPSSDYQQVMDDTGLFFPFVLKFISGKAYILQNLRPEDQIPLGSEIISINDESISQVLSELTKMLPSDGNNETYKFRILDWYFPQKYFLYIEQPDTFKLEYLPPQKGEIATAVVRGMPLDKMNNTWFSYERLYSECLKLEIREGSRLAILTIRTFVPRILKHYGYDFYRFMEASFREIKDKDISNLIIDLRWNDGGEVLYCRDLLAYLMDEPFQFANLETTSKPRYSFLEYTDKGLYFNYFHPELWARDDRGRYVLKDNLDKVEPKAQSFDGRVYVLVNGMSISGSADIAALLHYYKRATFIGEETGGAYYGNNAGDFINLTLPNTHIRITIPIRSSLLAVSNYASTERGVVPDFELKPKIEDILKGIDNNLDFAIQLIENDKARH
jgi:hypothetical protein